jgi:hypothetical protein
MQGGAATFAKSVPVRETFEGKSVWVGVMHVFDLAASCGDPRVRLVIGDREKHERTVLRRATYRTD